MSIKLHCEHCGAAVTAPHDLAGKTSKCPACGNNVYVPTPEEEIEELPLAPEDSSDLQREQALQEERRRLDMMLARESRAPEEADSAGVLRPAGPAAGAASPAASGNRTEQALRKYLAAMRDSDLNSAERALLTLQLQPRTARELVDRLATDQIPPPEMVNVPAGVYQGFLKTLRAKL